MHRSGHGHTATALNNFSGVREAIRLALLGADGPAGTFSDESGTVAR